VGIRELKAKLSECVRAVKEGATVIVTEHGRPVARLVPEPDSLRARMLALARAGDIVWNGQPFKPAGPVARVRGSRTLADLIVEERDRQ
jgi:prevent-host-death family protein